MSISTTHVDDAIRRIVQKVPNSKTGNGELAELSREIFETSVFSPCPHSLPEQRAKFDRMADLLEKIVSAANQSKAQAGAGNGTFCLNCMKSRYECDCETVTLR